MGNLIPVAQITLAIFLIVLILFQSKGTGLGTTFGGDFGFYGTKRGAEKILFNTTILVAILFLLITLLGLFV